MRAAIITGAIIFAAMLWAGQKPQEPKTMKQTSCKPTDLVGIGRCSAVVGEMCCNVR